MRIQSVLCNLCFRKSDASREHPGFAQTVLCSCEFVLLRSAKPQCADEGWRCWGLTRCTQGWGRSHGVIVFGSAMPSHLFECGVEFWEAGGIVCVPQTVQFVRWPWTTVLEAVLETGESSHSGNSGTALSVPWRIKLLGGWGNLETPHMLHLCFFLPLWRKGAELQSKKLTLSLGAGKGQRQMHSRGPSCTACSGKMAQSDTKQGTRTYNLVWLGTAAVLSWCSGSCSFTL